MKQLFTVFFFYLFVLRMILPPNNLFVFVTAGAAQDSCTAARTPAGHSTLGCVIDTWVLSKFCLHTANVIVPSLLPLKKRICLAPSSCTLLSASNKHIFLHVVYLK